MRLGVRIACGAELATQAAMSRIIVITGGTAGVGRATACRFALAGDSVAVLARGHDGLTATVADIERLGGRGLAIATDVAAPAQVDAAAARIEAELGPIDVWINNAMTTIVAPVTEIAPGEMRRVTDVCYHGTVWGTQAALRHMRPRNRGTIIQVGSALAYRSIPLQAAYCGAKHAIRGFTDSLRSELLHDRVNVALCMVQLPAVNTPQFDWCVNRMSHAVEPVPPIFQPEIVADAIYRVSRHPRREVFLGWPAIKAIVGSMVVPGYADRYLATHGYTGQLTDRPNTHPPANLFAPVAGDHGAHGRFDDKARPDDLIARAATVLGAAGVQAVLAAGVGVLGAAAFGAARALLSRRSR
jgi:NAD(P)-dependent dehydrogenase (short-subunit alcohol dehydrogenase family)